MEIPDFKYIKSKVPSDLMNICLSYEGWIVGGSARFLLGIEERVRDWDILVPWNRWGEASMNLIPKGTPANSCGGTDNTRLGVRT